MSTRRSSPAQLERDPDVAGAETALERAATRATERAKRVAGIVGRAQPLEKAGGLRGTQVDCDPRQISFSQAHGYEEIPGPLRLGELPREARTRIWNLFFVHLDSSKATDDVFGGSWIGRGWRHVLRDVHAKFHVSALDEWDSDFRPACKKLREYIEARPFNKVFDLIQFVLRHRQCPPEFARKMQHTFSECRLAYRIDIARPPTIYPAATPEEGRAIADALGTLRQAGMHGSAAHLRNAAEHVSAGDWAGSVRESIHAVESVARQLDPDAAKTAAPALSALEKRGALHPALKRALNTLYGYTSDEQGIRHALLDQSKAQVGRDEAVFMLGACAAFASYLWRRHAAGASG